MPLIHPEGPRPPWRMCSLNHAPGKVGVTWGGAGGLGARRRDCDGHCEVGPSKGLGVYAPAWETWVVGELSLHFIEG